MAENKGWGSAKTKQRDADWRDNFDQGEFTDGEFVTLRPIGPVNSFAQHWIEFTGKDGKKKTFPVTCRNWDSEKEEFIANGCPACKRQLKTQVKHFGNFINRDLQENRPAKAKLEEATKSKKFRTPNDKSWSPVKVYILPSTAVDGLKDIYALNKHKIKDPETREVTMVACEPSDPDYGCDVRIKYDSNKDGSNKYNVQKGDHSPLTDEERTYMLYDLDVLFYPEKEALEQKLRGFEERAGKKKPSVMDDDEDTDMPPARTGKRSKIEDNDDEDDEKPVKKPAKKLPPPVDEDDEPEEKPVKKPKKQVEPEDDEPAPKPAKKPKKQVEEDEEATESTRKSCFGTYVRKAKCWECDDRAECVEAHNAESGDEDDDN